MSEIENSRESFNAASDANDSLEPGELKLTPPRNSPILSHDVTRDQKRSSISSLDILKNYQSDHEDHRKDNNEDDNGGGGGKYYEHRRNFQNNRRSPTNNQRFYNKYNPNFRNNNRNFKSRPGFKRGGRGGFMHGRNRNFGYRNNFRPSEHQFDNQKQYNINKSNNLLSYTRTKPSISWRVNETFQNFKKIEQNVTVDDEKVPVTTNDEPEISKKDKFDKSNKDNSELSINISDRKHKKSKKCNTQRSESETRNKNSDRNNSKSSERSVKEKKSDKKYKKEKNIKENSNENIDVDKPKILKKKKMKKNKRKHSRSEESEPKTPPLIIKSTTPELKIIENPKEQLTETTDNIRSLTPEINKEQKLKRKISYSSNSSQKSKKQSNNNKKNKLNPHSLSFVDDLYDNDNSSNDIFPLSKDESISTKNDLKTKKIKIENKSDSNMSDSPDTDEYQDMWEEDEELTNSQLRESTDNRIIETIKRPDTIKKSKSMEKLPNNLITDEMSIQNIKIEKDVNADTAILTTNVNQDLNNKSSKKFIEDIFSENSRETENEPETAEEKDIKDGLSTPIFVNPSPPSDAVIQLSSNTPPPTVTVTPVAVAKHSEENPTKIDIFKEDNDEFEPAIDPNKKLLFGMQDIYEQFLQSVTNAGIDISSNENNESTPKSMKIPKEIISPLELEATAPPSILTNIENITIKPETLTTELVLLHNEQNKSDTDIPKRMSSPSSSSTTSSSSSSSTSSDSSDSSTTSTSTTTSSTNSSDQKDKNSKNDSPEYLQLFTKEEKKKLRALQKRLETLKSWSAMDEDEQDCFQGLQKVLENEINLLIRKYINVDNIEPKIDDPTPTVPAIVKEPIPIKKEPLDENNKIFDANRDTIKMKISPKLTNIPNKIWPMPIPQIFSIEEEIAKAKANNIMNNNNNCATNESSDKATKNDEKVSNDKKSKSSSSDLHSSSSSRRSTRSPFGNRSPDKNHRDSNTSGSRSSPSRDRRSRGSPHSDNRKSSNSNHNLKSRRRNRHSRSRSHSPVKRFRGDSPSRKIPRRRDINKSFRGGGGRGGSFYRCSYSRSRSRSNSRSRFSRRRSISPYMSRRYSRSPPFRPPSPPPSHKIRHGGSRSSTHSRSRSISPSQQHRHIQRISPLPWSRDENNCSQYYDAEELYSSYSLSPNRSTLDNRINQELNIRPIGTAIPSYQSYTQFNSYNDYMPTMQITNSAAGQFNNNNNPYSVGYQQNTNIQGNQQEYCTTPVTDDYHTSYYYNPTNNNRITEYQQNPNIKPVIREDFKNNLDAIPTNPNVSDFSIAVQKGNVLEIVPASIYPHTSVAADNLPTDKIIIKNENNYKIDMEKKNFGEKKKIPSWKEEVNRRNVLCAVLKLNRETDGTMKSILINVPDCSKQKDKKLVLFADGIRPGNGPNDEKSTIYKKEKKIRKSNKDKKKTVNILIDNKENENVQELLNVDTKIDIQLENAPPPPPPPGSPPPYIEQPILIRKNSPEQLLYFHFDPVVNSMYVSQIPNAIPPRLLNRQNQSNATNQSPGQLPTSSIGNNGNGKSPSIPSSSPNISHDKSIMPKNSLPRCDKFINSPRIPCPTAIPPPQSPTGQYPTNTIGYHQRFHNINTNNMKNTSMSSCNFSMPPPSINQQFQPLCFLPSSRPPSLEQLKRATSTLPFNPIIPPPIPITDNTPAFSSDSGSSLSFFKNENSGITYPTHGGVTSGQQQFIRNDAKNSTNLYNITTVTSTP